MRTLVWYRGKDLRVADHAPLHDALAAGKAADREIVTLFVLDPFFFSKKAAAELPHRMQFLLGALTALHANIAHLGGHLFVVGGRAIDVIPEVVARARIDRVVAHRWVEPFGRKRDQIVASRLAVPFTLFEGETLAPPDALRNQSGEPYAVYTAFARAFGRQIDPGAPLRAPRAIPAPPRDVKLDEVAIPTMGELGLETNPQVIAGSEKAGRARLTAFLKGPLAGYAEARDRMDIDGTSRLSADLKFGTVSARTVHDAVIGARTRSNAKDVDKLVSELLWREFTHATLWARPELLETPYRATWIGFPWRARADADWKAWTTGHTGYPIVDASARQLLEEGYVHNRARMVSASFLTKHLLIDYRRGEAHYMKYLVDGDWASNNAGWQWTAGCGQDAQPYFRVFHPVKQGQRFDPEGDYVRRWIPELARLEPRHIHAPWEAPDAALEKAGIVLGKTYPRPIVDHAEARARFLAVANAHLKGNTLL